MLYRLLWIFLIYSLIGWIGETIAAAIRQKKFVNRGLLNGPLCTVYGVAAVVLTIALPELRGRWLLLFLFSTIYTTVIEWITGHLLERTNHGRWWDYSHIRGNLDGYVCLPYSLLWGALGVVQVRWINPLLMKLYGLIPAPVMHIMLWILVALLAVDAAGSIGTVLLHKPLSPHVEKAGNRLSALSIRVGSWITRRISRRMQRAHPQLRDKPVQGPPTVFAQGCSFYKLTLLFVIGAFLGDLTETIFCRITGGVWMSRSSVVWGPFSVVWGLALAAGTLLMYKYRSRSDGFLFLFGTFLGGAYEYFCSVFTEICYGTVFWDYSELPFNLGGRINLLYCFFWGIAAVVWLKYLYPVLSKWIEKIPMKPGKIITWLLAVFMVVNMGISAAALARYNDRSNDVPPQNVVDEFLDERFGDERMERIYPNAKQVK